MLWKEIPGYDGYFEISEVGDIRSKRKDNYSTWTDKDGYKRIKLQGKHWGIHQLVCMVFNGNSEEGQVVNHKDGNRANNHYQNLEWTTQKENTIHGFTNNGRKAVVVNKEDLRQDLEITLKCGEEIQIFPSQKVASQFLGRNGNYLAQRKSRGQMEATGTDGRTWQIVAKYKRGRE